jgi:hypothetical protein
MTLTVELAGALFTAAAVHRLALAITPLDSLMEQSVRVPVRVGREVPRRPARRPRVGGALDQLAARLDVPLEARGLSAYLLRHRLDITPPDGPAVTEAVIRLDDLARHFAPRRLRVPVWSRQRVEEPDSDRQVDPISAAQRTVAPRLFPGSGYQPVRGATGVRGRLRDGDGEPVPWPRVRAFGDQDELLGTAHGDERGEFMLVLRSTGLVPPPAPSELPIRLAFWVLDPDATPPEDQVLDDRDPLQSLVIEDAVDRDPAGRPTGAVDDQVLIGESIPTGYQPAPVTNDSLTAEIGRLLEPPPYELA